MLLGLVAGIAMPNESAKADFTFGAPTNLGPAVNNPYDIMGVCISRDGLELYFSSNQTGGYGGYDLMVSRRESTEHNWTIPVNLGEPSNTRYDAWAPSISTDGVTLYFSDPHDPPFGNSHPGGLGGRGDIWMARRATTDDPWGAPVNLGSAVNNRHAILPRISADDLSLYFTSHRSGSSGQCDIMMATRKTSAESFGSPTFLSHINSNGNEWAPEVSADGLTLFYMSNMDNPSSTSLNSLQLWMASRTSVSEPFKGPVKLPPRVNMAGYGAFWPGLSPDCSVLYFVSDRPGGFGGYDLWRVSIDPVVDFSGDGTVDSSDICFMIDYWGTDEPLCDIGPTPFGDGIVDVNDLKVLMSYWGREVQDGSLVAHWALDEAEGTIVFNSAGDNDGTVTGVPAWHPADGAMDGALPADGAMDGALEFDGATFVAADFVLDPKDGPFSVLAWVKGGAPGQVIVSQQGGANWLMADALDGSLMADLRAGGRSPVSLGSQTVIVTWDGINRRLHVDDVLVAEDTQAALEGAAGKQLIGCGATVSPDTFWTGLLDDVRIYNREVKP
jgi:Tol biopolymer transport system component